MKYLTKPAVCTGMQMSSRRLSDSFLAVAGAALLMLAPSVGSAQTSAVPAPPSGGLINPMATIFCAFSHKAYTVDSEANMVIVSNDTDGSLLRVPVGSEPVSIAANQINGRVYIANSGDGTVSVMDGKTDAILATVSVGAHPYSIAIDSVLDKIYVARTYSDDLMEIDGATNGVSGIKTGSQDLIAVNPKSHMVYLLGYEGGSLTFLDGKTGEFRKDSVGMHAWGMALNEETAALYVAKIGDADVVAIDAPMATPRVIGTGRIPCAIGINALTNTVYAVNYEDDSVTVVDGKTSQVVTTLAVGKRPQAIAVDVVHNLIYIANTKGESVTVVDGASNKIIDTIKTGKAPYALAIDPEAGKLHVANLDHTGFTTLDIGRFQQAGH
jgi:YVTN family beta-propeller protein